MDVKDRVFHEEPAAVAPGARLARIGLLLVHLGGVVLVGYSITEAWRFQLALKTLTGRSALFALLHLPWTTVLVVLGFAGLAAVIESGRIVRRVWRGDAEPDVGLHWRVLAYTALGCVVFNALVVSTPESFSGPFRVRLPFTAHIVTALAYGVYALWSLSLPWLRRAVPRGVRHGLDLACMSLTILLLLAEFALRIVAGVWPSPLLAAEASPPQIRRDAGRRAPGTLSFGFPMNSSGFYDTEFSPPSPTRGPVVVDIGGSASYGDVPHAYHFTTVAEGLLHGVQIYNMGYPGLGPADYLYLLRHDALPLQPDLIVVNLFVGNDISEGPSPAGPRRWYDADSYRVAVVWDRWRMTRRAKRIDADKVSGQANQTHEQLAKRYPWLTDPFKEPAGMDREAYTELELRNALSVCVPHHGTYPSFFRTLATIKQAAGDIPLAFMLIPDEFQVDDSLWSAITRRTDQPLDRDQPQRLILRTLKSEGQPALDLLPVLRAVPPLRDGRRHLYHLQDTDFNARGNDIAGHALAHFVDSLMATAVARRERALQAAEAVPPIALPLHLDPGTPGARHWMTRGWQAGEASSGGTFAWSDGDQSQLAIPLPTGADVRMSFEVLPFTFAGSPPQHITVTLNDVPVGDVRLERGMGRYSVTLPAADLRRGLQQLDLRYAYARAPKDVIAGAGDVRVLAVAWYGIDFARGTP